MVEWAILIGYLFTLGMVLRATKSEKSKHVVFLVGFFAFAIFACIWTSGHASHEDVDNMEFIN